MNGVYQARRQGLQPSDMRCGTWIYLQQQKNQLNLTSVCVCVCAPLPVCVCLCDRRRQRVKVVLKVILPPNFSSSAESARLWSEEPDPQEPSVHLHLRIWICIDLLRAPDGWAADGTEPQTQRLISEPICLPHIGWGDQRAKLPKILEQSVLKWTRWRIIYLPNEQTIRRGKFTVRPLLSTHGG